jgi:arylsulfatase A-like enzyme
LRTSLRRAATAIALLYVVAALPADATGTERAAQADARPNVLIFITDDQRRRLGAMPETRRYFKQQGRAFTRAFATTPLCCPSRASIMTGLYAHNHGVLDNIPNEAYLIRDDTLQAKLQARGYVSALYGKYLNKWPVSKDPPHFDHYSTMKVGYNDAFWNVDGEIVQRYGYTTSILGDEAVDFVESRQGRPEPWLMYVNPHAPHAPFTPADQYEDASVSKWRGNRAVWEWDRSDKPRYVRRGTATIRDGREVREGQQRTLMSVDDVVGRVMGAVQRTGQMDETLAFFMSDNGYMWGEHGLLRKGTPYEQSTRIPLYVRWPRRFGAATKDRRLVANIDIAPTVLDVVGLPTSGLDGHSLVKERWNRRRLLLEYWCNVRDCNRWAALRTRSYEYIEYYSPSGGIRFREYYDLRRDPWQIRNLLKDRRPRNDPDVRSLHDLLRADRRCVSKACP